ncbi:DNA-processing protein DprA, partial [Actinomycetospora atypica]
ALGVESEALRGAVAADGAPVVVAPCGIDRVHPSANRDLFEEVLARGGAIVSPYPPGLAVGRDRVMGRLRLLAGLAEAGGRPVTPTDTEVLAHVLRDLTGLAAGNTRPRPITIPDVHRALTRAEDGLWQTHRFASRQHFLDATRPLTDSLGALVNGPLKGLFDEQTNIDVDWAAPIQSLDVSGLEGRGEKALAVAMTCLGSWSRSATDLRTDGALRIIVRDEIWRQMRLGTGMVAAVDAELRLSRAQQ